MQFREVERADPEAARASYTPPPAETRVAQRATGFRLPVWVFLLILLILGLVIFFAAGGTELFRSTQPAQEAVSLLALAAAETSET